MLELQLLEFLAFGMEINTTDGPGFLVEANVVETLEAGPIYGPHSMVRYKETLLPAHENIFFRSKIGNGDITTLSYRLGVGPEGSEFVPVGHVNLVGCAPVWVIRQKPIFRADDLAFEKGCERGVVFRQALNSEISTQGRFSQVNVFDFNLNIINLPLRLLRAVEFATRSQEGRSRGRY